MNFLITENQLKLILSEAPKSQFTENMRILNAFTNNLINRVRRKFGLNLKLLATWGTSVGGLVLPLDEYIKTGNFNLNENQSALILLGVIAIIYLDNKSMIKKIFSKVKEENIQEEFENILGKGYELRKAFLGFLNSLDVSAKSFSELISYSFLIPIITDIQDVVTKSSDIPTSSENIATRLLASGLVLVGSEVLQELIKSISKRFKQV